MDVDANEPDRAVGGRTIEVTARPLGPGGAVILAEDVTEAQARDRDQQQLRSEHRSLFENSVYGIYRDTLDGQVESLFIRL